MGRSVIVAYRPKPAMDDALLGVVRDHMRVLREENLVTDREAWVLRGAGGTLIEVFEWRSAAAIEQAHTNPAVLALWERFAAACDYSPLANLAEAQQMFAEFDTVEL